MAELAAARPDVPATIAALKEDDGPELQVHGSGDLMQTLMRHDLVDEFRWFPVSFLLGPQAELFGEGAMPAGLELVESETLRGTAVPARWTGRRGQGRDPGGARRNWTVTEGRGAGRPTQEVAMRHTVCSSAATSA